MLVPSNYANKTLFASRSICAEVMAEGEAGGLQAGRHGVKLNSVGSPVLKGGFLTDRHVLYGSECGGLPVCFVSCHRSSGV